MDAEEAGKIMDGAVSSLVDRIREIYEYGEGQDWQDIDMLVLKEVVDFANYYARLAKSYNIRLKVK